MLWTPKQTKPLWKLTPEYGVSDVALGKTCRKLQIPMPGIGHCAKVAAGERVKARPPLAPFPAQEQK
jgi:hypothetical protein